MRAFFRRHPKIHTTIHWVSVTLGGLLLAQDRILGATAFFPADSVLPRYIGYGLGVLAFSNLLVGKADSALSEQTAKVETVESEAKTKPEKK
jgi:hypothetical protein